MKQITATYDTYVKFNIPKGVYLLPYEENEKANEGTYGMWWIKWNVLRYYDEKGEIHLIESVDEETDMKWPANIDVEDVSSDEESN